MTNPNAFATPSRPRRRSRFTLTELLVVVAIIATLAALLLPLLGRSRHVAVATQCASNMRQLYSGLPLYASDFNGRLPPLHVQSGVGRGYNEPGSPTDLYYLYSWGEPYGYDPGAWNLGHMNHGLLYDTGLIEDPGVYYCPGVRSRALQSTYYEPWMSPGPWSGRVRSGYYYNPHVTLPGGAGGTGIREYNSLVQDIPAEKIMLMDWIWLDTIHSGKFDGSVTEYNGHWPLFSWNITRADGSTSRAQPGRSEMIAIGADWRTGGNQSWTAFLDAVDLLEQ